MSNVSAECLECGWKGKAGECETKILPSDMSYDEVQEINCTECRDGDIEL